MEQVVLEYCKREMAHLHDAEKQELDCARLVARACPVKLSTLRSSRLSHVGLHITKRGSRLIRHKNR